jgi:hypothetical protein
MQQQSAPQRTGPTLCKKQHFDSTGWCFNTSKKGGNYIKVRVFYKEQVVGLSRVNTSGICRIGAGQHFLTLPLGLEVMPGLCESSSFCTLYITNIYILPQY